MTRTERVSLSAGKALAIGAAAAALFAPVAFADTESDPKMRDRRPAVVHPIVRYKSLPGGQLPPEGNFPSQNVELQTWIPLNNFPLWPGNGNSADSWGYVSPSGREYALIGLSWGNGIVEVTNPANPTIITTIAGGVNVLWRDITVVGTRCYAASDSAGVGIQVMDLSNIDNGQVTFIGNIAQGGHSTTHTLLENTASGYLYACGANLGGGGLLPLSTANPNNPVFTGPGWTDTYVHEAQIVTYTSGPYAGKEIAFLYIGGSGLAIADVTNKNNIIELYQNTYPGESYSHQGWISPDGKYLYHDDEIDGPPSMPYFTTRVFNIENLSNPRLCATFTNGIGSVDHNQYVNGNYLYQSNYKSGYRVWDLSDPLRPVEVAWLDTYPEDNGSGYSGCWGNYSFFPSGTVIASDIPRGLFIMKVSILKLTPGSTPTQLAPGQATPLTVNVAARDATVNTASVKLHVKVNAGAYTEVPMAHQGGTAYSGSIPAGTCLDRVQYYFSAQTTDVPPRTFTWPLTGAAEALKATVRDSETTLFSDNFQNNMGWTVANNASLTAGAWVRAVPAANGGHGAAIGDADGSGMAYVTGNGASEDVDGGPTQLLSPVFNLGSAPEAVITYSRWFLSIRNTLDTLLVEVSNNNGTTWTQVENLGPSSGAWQKKSFRVADFVAPTAQVRLRFSVNDANNNSDTEAGVDAVSVTAPVCDAPCYPDCNNSGNLTIADFTCFQAEFVAGNPYADCNNSGNLTIADFTCFQAAFVAGCP